MRKSPSGFAVWAISNRLTHRETARIERCPEPTASALADPRKLKHAAQNDGIRSEYRSSEGGDGNTRLVAD